MISIPDPTLFRRAHAALFLSSLHRWYNSTDMDLMLSMDKTFHITAHGMYVTPTSSAVDRRRLLACAGLCVIAVSVAIGVARVEMERAGWF